MKDIKQHFIREKILYTGEQLRSHWILKQTGVLGDAIVSFKGGADVSVARLVDLVDVKENAPIWSSLMLHFIVEHFGISLENAIFRQRLLVAIIADEFKKYPKAKKVIRRGDDLYDGKKKLSVSIAAKSPVSCCIHTALNIDSVGTPVSTIGLADYNIDAKRFALNIMKNYAHENSQMSVACSKVRPIP